MDRFAVGFAIPLIGQLGWIVYGVGLYGVVRTSEWLALALLLVALPAVCATAVAGLVQLRRPRRMLARRSKWRLGGVAWGILAGCLAWSIVAVTIALVGDKIPDAVIVAISAILAAGAAVWVLPVQRIGRCAACNYDIRGSLSFGRCPECGLAISPR